MRNMFGNKKKKAAEECRKGDEEAKQGNWADAYLYFGNAVNLYSKDHVLWLKHGDSAYRLAENGGIGLVFLKDESPEEYFNRLYKNASTSFKRSLHLFPEMDNKQKSIIYLRLGQIELHFNHLLESENYFKMAIILTEYDDPIQAEMYTDLTNCCGKQFVEHVNVPNSDEEILTHLFKKTVEYWNLSIKFSLDKESEEVKQSSEELAAFERTWNKYSEER